MQKLFFLIVVALIANSGYAQTTAEKETKEIHFRIASTFKKGDSLFAYINAGAGEGIENNLFGKCINLYRAGVSEHYTELATCRITFVGKVLSLAHIQLYKTNSSKDSIFKGDFASFNVAIPKIESRSLLFDIASLDIFLSDMYKTNMYTINDVIDRDSKVLEDTIINRFVSDIKQTYIDVKDLFKETEPIKQPMKEGRYMGKTVLEVMRDVKPADVRAYLMFVKSYPFKYMGYNYKANETFATWVLNTAFTSSSELEDLILSKNFSEPALQKLTIAYSKSIIKDKIAESLVEKAVSFFNAGKKAESEKILVQAKKMVDRLNDTAGKASYFLNLAQIKQDEEKYREAIKLSEQAMVQALLCKNKDYELRALFKRVYCHYKLSDYRAGKTTIGLAELTLAQYKDFLPPSTYTENLRKVHEYSGWINYSSGDYEIALSHLRKAIAINNQTNTYAAKSNNASNYWYIGKTYLGQGKYKEALQVFDTSLNMYRSVNNVASEGFLVNELGYTQFKLLDYETSIKMHQQAYDILMPIKSYNNAGYSKSMIAQSLWNLGKYKEAIAAHTESIDLRKKANNHEGEAFSWEKMGNLYELSGEKTKALAAFDSAAFYYAIIKDSVSIAKNLNNIGKVYENDNDKKAASGYYEKALQYLKSIQDKTGQVNALFHLGLLNYEDDTTRSRKFFEECLVLSVSSGDRSNQLYSLVNLGSLASISSKVEKQQSFYQQALNLSKEINTTDMEAYCYSRMAAGYERQLEFDKALEYYTKAQNLYDTVDKKEYIKQLVYAGGIMISKGDYDNADKNYQKAIETSISTGNKLELADALTSASFLYNLQGEFAKGMQSIDSASAIYKATGNKIKLASSFESWGLLFKGLGEYAKSVQSYLSADSIYKTEKKEHYRQNININIGVTYFFQADYKKALDYFKKAEATLPAVVDETYLLVKANIAECYYYLKQPDEAEKIYKGIYPLAKDKNVNRIASGMGVVLGRIYYDKKQYDLATQYLQSAVEHGYKSKEKEKIIEALMYLGKVQAAQNKLAEAEKSLHEAASVTRQFKITSFGWESLYELGMFYYNNNKIDSAVAAFKDAVEIVEKNAGNVYGGEEAKKLYKASEKKVDLYNKLVASLAKAGNTQDAFAYANKSNLTAIKELQGGAIANNTDKTAAINQANNLLQQTAAIDKSINALEGKSDAEKAGQLQTLQEKKAIVEKEYLNYINNLIKKYPDLSLYFAKSVNPEQFKNYKNKLPRDVAAVLYLINDAQLLTFTVTNEKIGIKITELKEDINKTLSDFIGVLNVPGKSSGTGTLTLRSTILSEKKAPSGVSFTATSEKLYNLLIGDIENEIKGKKRICIIPNGKLANIPFQCLGKRLPDSTFHFVVEDYAVFYTNTLDIFLSADDTEKDFKSFTAFGNPDKTLKSAGTEVKEIGKILNASNIYTEDMATEQRAKESLTTNKYIHFATHGVLDYTDFSKSYLKFAIDKDNDGKLSIEEMKALDIINCNLVMLSACETAVTQSESKGWYASPANSLLMNNVKSVVASLWQVDDEATSIFMKEFYKNVTAMSKVDALRKAQETLSHNPKYVHPFFWGAFVLYGDWR
jgi:tetratricopeptide (TPR) repeat protein